MTEVFVERRTPMTVSDNMMQGIATKMHTCLGIHRVSWCGSLLSEDGNEMFCHFQGVDVESVRIAMRQSGAPPGLAWACHVQDSPGLADGELAAVNAIVLHTFAEPVKAAAQASHPAIAADILGAHGVRLLRSYLSGDGLKMVALYQAPDAQALHAVQRQAGWPADRVVPVRRYAPETLAGP